MQACRCTLFLLAACTLFGQSASQTFHLTTAPNPAAVNEIATILRTVGDIRQLAADDAKFEITVNGTDADLAFAAWVVKQLDTQSPKPAEYAMPGGTEVVNTLFPTNTASQSGLNELVTSLRTVGNVPRIFTYSPAHGVVLRTPVSKAPLALWLAHQLDVAPNDQNRFQPHEYDIPGAPAQVVKVVYLIHQMQQSDLNEMVTTIRTITDIHAIFTRSQPQGIAFSGTAAQAQLGDWLFQQLDVQPDAEMRAEKHEYQVPSTPDDITRVYYLKSTNNHEAAVAIRSETGISRIFLCTGTKALAVRGASDAIAIADRVVKQHDGPAAP